ncbi:hypothetical protein [Gilvimarinus agarilyticus]|uniref:hypothetical protein n=1 Tax=Gilvimarinus agarilyticus TaxID=679259 RepID=UPI0005A23C7C|nr:hypothetical protein [Gilvimarinus agarilyticus]
MQLKLMVSGLALASLLVACGSDDDDGSPVVQETTSYQVKVNTKTDAETTTSTQEVAEGSAAQIELNVAQGQTLLSASGCGGALNNEMPPTFYVIDSVTSDCEVTLELATKPSGLSVVSKPQAIAVQVNQAEPVNLLWSTDPYCDWVNYADCANSGAKVDLASGELLLSASNGDLLLDQGYFFVLEKSGAYSEVSGGRTLRTSPSYSGSGKMLIYDDTLFMTTGHGLGSVSNATKYAIIDGDNRELTGALPHPDGYLNVTAKDGQGGWYLGGTFARLDDTPRRNIARISNSGAIDEAWNATTNGEITALAYTPQGVIVGGEFTVVNGESHHGFVVLDHETGATVYGGTTAQQEAYSELINFSVVGNTVYVAWYEPPQGAGRGESLLSAFDIDKGEFIWSVETNGGIEDVSANSQGAYIAGLFTTVGGARKSKLALINPQGELTDWNANLYDSAYPINLVATEDTLYMLDVPGRIAPVVLRAFDTQTTERIDLGLSEYTKVSMIYGDGGEAFIGGGFYVGLEEHPEDPNNPELLYGLLSLNNNSMIQLPVHGTRATLGSIAFSEGDLLFVGPLEFYPQDVDPVIAIDPKTGLYKDWSSSLGRASNVTDIEQKDGTLYVSTSVPGAVPSPEGSDFPFVRDHRHLYAIDAATGNYESFTAEFKRPILPDALPTDYTAMINDIEIINDTLYAAGEFTLVNDEPRYGLASFTLPEGTLTEWAPQLDDIPYALDSRDGKLYVAGGFTSIDGKGRTHLAVFEHSNGELSDWVADEVSVASQLVPRSIHLTEDFISLGGTYDPALSAEGESLVLASLETGKAMDLGLKYLAAPHTSIIYTVTGDENNLYIGGENYLLDAGADDLHGFFNITPATGEISQLGLTIQGSVKNISIQGDVALFSGIFHLRGDGNFSGRRNLSAINLTTGEIIW